MCIVLWDVRQVLGRDGRRGRGREGERGRGREGRRERERERELNTVSGCEKCSLLLCVCPVH